MAACQEGTLHLSRLNTTDIVIIVEGKNDQSRIQDLVRSDVKILCTFGIPNHTKVTQLVDSIRDAQVVIFTDNDHVGKRIRAILGEEFPDALHLRTKSEYGGVEKTPFEYLTQLLIKHELIREDLMPKNL